MLYVRLGVVIFTKASPKLVIKLYKLGRRSVATGPMMLRNAALTTTEIYNSNYGLLKQHNFYSINYKITTAAITVLRNEC